MPRGVVLVILAAAVLAFTGVAARADEHWGAISMSVDGAWSATANRYTRSEALSYTRKDCREKSSQPGECIDQTVEGDDAAIAWHCGPAGTDGYIVITVGRASDDIDGHARIAKQGAERNGYDPGQCKPLCFITGTDARKL